VRMNSPAWRSIFAGKGMIFMQLFYIVLQGFVVYYRRFQTWKHILPGTGNKRP
jgi:hypothetical protein